MKQVLKKSAWRGPLKQGRNASTSIIINAQRVKNTDSAEHKGYDAGTKITGIQRHIAVDMLGLPHAIEVTTAKVTDRTGALKAITRYTANLTQVTSVLVDGGYSGQPFATADHDQLGATVQVAKRNELHTFEVIPQR